MFSQIQKVSKVTLEVAEHLNI